MRRTPLRFFPTLASLLFFCLTVSLAFGLTASLAETLPHETEPLPKELVVPLEVASAGIEIRSLQASALKSAQLRRDYSQPVVEIDCYRGDPADPVFHQRYSTARGNLITERENLSCDHVSLSYAQSGGKKLHDAKISRLGYSVAQQRWRRFQTWPADEIFNFPGQSRARWHEAWPDGYWWVAHGLEQAYSGRRTVLELVFDDESNRTIEISPPFTYGYEIECIDNGNVAKRWRIDLEKTFSSKPAFADEAGNRACDTIRLHIDLEAGNKPYFIALSILKFNERRKEWTDGGSFLPDEDRIIDHGLSGYSRIFEWNESWPDDTLLTASRRSGRYSQRKAVFYLPGSRPGAVELRPRPDRSLEESWPDGFAYLGNYPKDRQTKWSDELNGVTHDEDHWYFTQKKYVLKFALDRVSSSSGWIARVRVPPALEEIRHGAGKYVHVYQPIIGEHTFELFYKGFLVLRDETGRPIDIPHMQGGDFLENGHLYLSSGFINKHYPHEGINAFDLSTGRRIAHLDVEPSYHPECPSGSPWSWGNRCEEVQGLTLWDLDDSPVNGLGGQIHLILLDNDATDDDFYLKHYRADGKEKL